jgi:hypothetical protein
MGQARTADGIAAMFAGDYAAAARILQPLAEDPSDFDPLAAFFLATLYHSGKGAAHDEFHACGLYLKAAVPANPFAAQSLSRGRFIEIIQPDASCVRRPATRSRTKPGRMHRLLRRRRCVPASTPSHAATISLSRRC